MVRIVIADDVQILRQGLCAIFSREPDIRVVGLAADGKEAWELCRQQRPDVVLMDMRMPEYYGSWGISRIKEDFPSIKVLVLTTFDDRETVEAAIRRGADGYLLKEMEDAQVIQSVKAASAGLRVFGSSVFEGIRQNLSQGSPEGNPLSPSPQEKFGITNRERELMKCVAQGMDNKEIAAGLFLAEGTVRNNISRLLEKLKLKDRTQLAVFAVKNHLD